MWKKIIISITAILIGVVCFSFIKYQVDIRQYYQNIEKTISISSEDLYSKIEELDKNEEINVYVGRPTCPYCREFSSEIDFALNNSTSELYYLESRTDNQDMVLEDIRDRYNIEYVPSVIKISKENFSTFDEQKQKLIDFL